MCLKCKCGYISDQVPCIFCRRKAPSDVTNHYLVKNGEWFEIYAKSDQLIRYRTKNPIAAYLKMNRLDKLLPYIRELVDRHMKKVAEEKRRRERLIESSDRIIDDDGWFFENECNNESNLFAETGV